MPARSCARFVSARLIGRPPARRPGSRASSWTRPAPRRCGGSPTPISRWASTVVAPICGVRMTFGRSASGGIRPSPSATWTSSPAPAGPPGPSSASRRAASSTTPPRAMLTRKLPDFIRPSSAGPMSPRVDGPSGTWMLRKSDRSSTSSRGSRSMPSLANRAARSGLGSATQPMVVMPHARPSRATVVPIEPRPTMPSVLPPRFQPTTSFLAQCPLRHMRSTSTTWRASPRNIANVSSATARAPGPGIRCRWMPRDRTDSISRLSSPDPARTIVCNRGAASSRARSMSSPDRKISTSRSAICASRSARAAPTAVMTSWLDWSAARASGSILDATRILMRHPPAARVSRSPGP